MKVIKVPREIIEERARRAGVSVEVWQRQADARVAVMRTEASRQLTEPRVLNVSELSESQRRALRRMDFLGQSQY